MHDGVRLASGLYEAKTKTLKIELENEKSELEDSRKRDYKIYRVCFSTAYYNGLENNRDAKITSDEFSIILTLSKQLELSQEEIKLLNYSVLPIKKSDILDVINNLKNTGVVFFSKKENTIYAADEMVRLLRKLREKEVAEKFYRRTLKLWHEPIY